MDNDNYAGPYFLLQLLGDGLFLLFSFVAALSIAVGQPVFPGSLSHLLFFLYLCVGWYVLFLFDVSQGGERYGLRPQYHIKWRLAIRGAYGQVGVRPSNGL